MNLAMMVVLVENAVRLDLLIAMVAGQHVIEDCTATYTITEEASNGGRMQLFPWRNYKL